jgi:ribosomal protein S13
MLYEAVWLARVPITVARREHPVVHCDDHPPVKPHMLLQNTKIRNCNPRRFHHNKMLISAELATRVGWARISDMQVVFPEVQAASILAFEFSSSSTCDRCSSTLLSLSISLSRTASTSIGGSRSIRCARFQRFSRAIPVQGCRTQLTLARAKQQERMTVEVVMAPRDRQTYPVV